MDSNTVYTGEPTANLKCIIISIFCALFYWFAPRRNKYVLVAILYLIYLCIAWYDYLYLCERSMSPTYLSLFYIWFKPKASKQIIEYKNWDPKIKKRVIIVDVIVLLTLLALTPVF
jgi:hypothetical protein